MSNKAPSLNVLVERMLTQQGSAIATAANDALESLGTPCPGSPAFWDREWAEHSEHTDTVLGAFVEDPPGFRGRSVQQLLGHDQAQEFRVIELDLPAGTTGPGVAQVRQDTVGEEDIECGQEGVEFIVHTKGLTPTRCDSAAG